MAVRYFSKLVLLLLLCVLIPLYFQFATAENRCKDGETEIDCGPFADVTLCAKYSLLFAEKRLAAEDAEEDALWTDFVDTALDAENDAEDAVASGVSVDAANAARSATVPNTTDDGANLQTDECGDPSIKKSDCEAQNCIWVAELDPSCRMSKKSRNLLEEEEEVNFGLSDIFQARIGV